MLLVEGAAMSRASQHYERAFESYLTRRRVPHVLVDDAKRAVLPPGTKLSCTTASGAPVKVKSFDAVVYGPGWAGASGADDDSARGMGRRSGAELAGRNLLVEVKGRRVDLRKGGSGRRESWTTVGDIASLSAWERLFGESFEAVLVFLYWLDGPALNAMEREVFRFEGRAYAHRAVLVRDYARLMRVRSPKWGTVNLSADDFGAVGVPLDVMFGTRQGAMVSDAGEGPDGPRSGRGTGRGTGRGGDTDRARAVAGSGLGAGVGDRNGVVAAGCPAA